MAPNSISATSTAAGRRPSTDEVVRVHVPASPRPQGGNAHGVGGNPGLSLAAHVVAPSLVPMPLGPAVVLHVPEADGDDQFQIAHDVLVHTVWVAAGTFGFHAAFMLLYSAVRPITPDNDDPMRSTLSAAGLWVGFVLSIAMRMLLSQLPDRREE